MADQKISELTELTTFPATGDLLPIVDVSDTSMAATGSDKKIKYSNLVNFVNIISFGALGDDATDNTAAINNAIAALPATGGVLFSPPGTFRSNTSAITGIPNGTVIMGSGRGATIWKSTSGSHNLFEFASNAKYITFQDMELSVHSAGGHVFAPAGIISHIYISRMHISQNNTAKSIWKQPDAGYYYNSWRECYCYHDGITTAPMFDFTGSTSENHNSNTWWRITTETVNTATAYLWDFGTSAANDFLYANYWRDITCEIPTGGVIRALTVHGFVFENIEIWDIGSASTKNDLFYIGAGSGGLQSRKIIFRNIERIGGNLGAGLVDIRLVTNKVRNVVLDSLQTANFNTFTVDLGTNPDVDVINCHGVAFQNRGLTAMIPKIKARATDSGAVNNNTLADDDTLFWSVKTSETWWFEGFLLFSAANTSMDIQIGWDYPTGTTMSWGILSSTAAVGWSSVGSGSTPGIMRTQSQTVAAGSDNGLIGVPVAGFVYSGSTAGEVYVSWAQNTTDAGNLILKAGSFIRVTRLAG